MAEKTLYGCKLIDGQIDESLMDLDNIKTIQTTGWVDRCMMNKWVDAKLLNICIQYFLHLKKE